MKFFLMFIIFSADASLSGLIGLDAMVRHGRSMQNIRPSGMSGGSYRYNPTTLQCVVVGNPWIRFKTKQEVKKLKNNFKRVIEQCSDNHPIKLVWRLDSEKLSIQCKSKDKK